MKFLKLTLSALLFFISCSVAFSQNLEYEKKENFGHGLYKVMTNNRWGIIDKDGNLKLSAEHNEPILIDNAAVISKYGTNQLVGIMDAAGNIIPTPQFFINPDFPYVTDGMLIVRETPDGKWGYLNVEKGFPVSVKLKGIKPGKNKELKALGINGKNLEGVFVFDFAAPFSDGIAAVWAERIGWLHIDKDGKPRLVNPEGRPALFRSSLNDGKAIIFDNRGTVLSMETPDRNAGVAMFIDEGVSTAGFSVKLTPPYSFSNNGFTLYLNNKFQADKLVKADGDSIIFIERKKPEVKIKKDTVSDIPPSPVATVAASEIKVSLSRKNVAANSKGTAIVTFNITNSGEATATDLKVTVDVQGSSKVWTGNLKAGSTVQVSVAVPARFSSPAVTKKARWTVRLSGKEASGGSSVTISRYKPNR